MNPFAIPKGLTGKKRILVSEKDTAAAYGSGLVPVFATPAMIALMENTAQESVRHYLPEGYTTVGSKVDIRHFRPTPTGKWVTCECILTDIHDATLTFAVSASDEKGLIGKGTHVRVIVDMEAFLAQAGI
ncbi:MAG: thioesterase family protein [Bacteroidales bacterium]|nr:thioesterase family protein [Lentimicrobiaceae bacterium]MDD5694328.1 thioesterase family protein [Bacteroidales bacterium]